MDAVHVSERAWHYRLYCFLCDPAPEGGRPRKQPVPRSLCTYFWTLVIGTALLPWWLLCFGVAWLVVVGAAAVAVLCRRVRRLLMRGPRPPRGPGLVRSYLKARKRRVCPLVIVDRGEG